MSSWVCQAELVEAALLVEFTFRQAQCDKPSFKNYYNKKVDSNLRIDLLLFKNTLRLRSV